MNLNINLMKVEKDYSEKKSTSVIDNNTSMDNYNNNNNYKIREKEDMINNIKYLDEIKSPKNSDSIFKNITNNKNDKNNKEKYKDKFNYKFNYYDNDNENDNDNNSSINEDSTKSNDIKVKENKQNLICQNMVTDFKNCMLMIKRIADYEIDFEKMKDLLSSNNMINGNKEI
jgi:hypothetical protein